MINPDLVEQYHAVCARLAQDSTGLFNWEWDARFEAALSTFKRDDAQRVLELLRREGAFGEEWTNEAVHTPAQEGLVQACGGLYPGQRLFLVGMTRSSVLIAMWWPWGDGDTISLRVRLVLAGVDEETKRDTFQAFRGWFGLR